MPKTVISYRFVANGNPTTPSGYITDIGTEISASSRFVLPPDVPLAQAATIVTALGGRKSTRNPPPVRIPEAAIYVDYFS